MRRPALIRVIIVVSMLVVFGRLCIAEFSWYDDPGTLHQNPSFNPPTISKVAEYWTAWGSRAPFGLYIPVTYSMWGALAKLAYIEQPDPLGIRLNSWVFHTANVFLHAGSALMVFSILRLLTRHDVAALIGALLFALHPLQVEAVGWASGLKDLLSGLLGLTAIWLHLKGRSNFMGIACVGLAMLAKPSAMIVPLVALIIDVTVLRRPARESLRTLWPWFLLVIPCMLWTRAAQPAADVPAVSIWLRPIVAMDAITFYFWKLVVPVGLAVDYGRTPRWVMEQARWPWVVGLIVVIAAALSRKRQGAMLTGMLIFIAGVLPVLGFVPFLFQYFSTVADHYLYLSMLGPALVVAMLVAKLPTRPTLLISAAMLIVLGVLSIRQGAFWHDDLRLWSHNLSINPNSALAHLNLGAALDRAGDVARAEHHYAEALRINPNDDAARENLQKLKSRRNR